MKLAKLSQERSSSSPKRWLWRAVTAATVATGLSTSLPALAYRTAGDSPDFADTDRVRWDPGVVPFVLYNDAPDSLPVSLVADVLTEALSPWQEPLCSALEWGFNGLTELPIRPEDRVNTVQWVNDWSDRGFRPDEAAITDILYAQSEGGDWRIVEADIYLNSEYFSWSLRGEVDGTRSVLSVFTHELGHAAGLMHPCEPGGDATTGAPACGSNEAWELTTMYPLYSATQAVLSQDDEDGVCFLYPAETCEQMGCSEGLTCTELGCQVLCGDTVCSLAEECIENECIDRCRDPSCQLGQECERDRDCHDSLQCVRNHCQAGQSEVGDPCTDSSECDSYVCIKFGYCAPICEMDEDCEGNGSRCRAGSGTARGCQSVLEPLGEPCTESNECLGEQCLGGYGEPVCTRRCGEDHPECPLGWSCDLVDGRSVCTPPFDGERGCTVGPGPAWPRFPSALLLTAAAGICLSARLGRARVDSGRRRTASLRRGESFRGDRKS